jgi:hypothetical protein
MKHISYDIVLYDLLTYKYPDIMSGMLCDEFYVLQDKVYDFVYLISYYNSVIGFLCGMFGDGLVMCELCYILPKFRGMGLFSSALNTINNLFNMDVCLYLPNSFAMESLLLHNHAIKLNERLIVSDFLLCYMVNEGDYVYSRLYDSDYCGIVHLPSRTMSPVLDNDIKLKHFERNVNDGYFDEVKDEVILEVMGL